MATKFCVSCGTPLANSRFCTRCGQPSTAQTTEPAPSTPPPVAHQSGPVPTHVLSAPADPAGVAPAAPQPRGRRAGLMVGGIAALVVLVAVGVGAIVLTLTSDQSETALGSPTADPTAAAGVATPAPSPSDAAPSGAQSPAPASAVADPENLDCSGRFVVVFNLTNDETELDKSKPWLEAENSCSGIDRSLGGKPLRFNYVGPFESADDACQQLLSMNPHSDYIKFLRADQGDGRHYLCSCDAAAGELPYLRDSGGAYPQAKVEFRAAVDLHLMLKRVQGFESDNLGLYGEQTTDAVSTYQSSQGLTPTGEVDSATWSQLLASSIACPT